MSACQRVSLALSSMSETLTSQRQANVLCTLLISTLGLPWRPVISASVVREALDNVWAKMLQLMGGGQPAWIASSVWVPAAT